MATVLTGTNVPDDGIKNVSMAVSTDESSNQFLAMKLSADLKIALQTSAGGAVFGILQDAPDGSGTATVGAVKTNGFSLAIAGGTCTVGGLGTVDSAGKFVDATGANKEAPVRFVEGTSTSGDRIIVELVHQHKE